MCKRSSIQFINFMYKRLNSIQFINIMYKRLSSIQFINFMCKRLDSIQFINFMCKRLSSVRNKASPSDSDLLKLLRTDWFQNLLDKFTLKQIVRITVRSEKSWFGLTGSKTHLEHHDTAFLYAVECVLRDSSKMSLKGAVKLKGSVARKQELWLS